MPIREEQNKIDLNGRLGLDVRVDAININHIHGPKQVDELMFDFGPEFDLPRLSQSHSLEGFTVAYNLKDNKGLKLTLKGKSRYGNPVDFKNEEIETTSSDESILKVTEEDGYISVVPVGPVGTAQVQVTVPGVLHDGVPLSGTFDVTVVPGDAVSLNFEPTETFDLPDLPPPVEEPTV